MLYNHKYHDIRVHDEFMQTFDHRHTHEGFVCICVCSTWNIITHTPQYVRYDSHCSKVGVFVVQFSQDSFFKL